MVVALVLSLVVSQPTPQKLRWDPRIDLPVTGVLVTGWALSELAFKKTLAPQACRWCETNGFDTAVRSVFNPTLSPSSDGVPGIHIASNVVGFGVVPVAVVGLGALLSYRDGVFLENFFIDTLLVLEATFGSLALNQTVKFSVGRARPYTVGASPETVAAGHEIEDNNVSFFSGHSNFTFAAVASAATVASLRGYRLAWLVWVVGIPLATATAVMRLAADKHWATDVLVGSALGLAAGILIPTLAHARVGAVSLSVSPAPNGLALSGRF